MCIEQFAEDDVCFRLACGHVFHRVRAASVHVAACCFFLGVRAVISALRGVHYCAQLLVVMFAFAQSEFAEPTCV